MGPSYAAKTIGYSSSFLAYGTVRYSFSKIFSYPDLIMSIETRLGDVCSADVSRSSFVFLKREILTPKLLRSHLRGRTVLYQILIMASTPSLSASSIIRLSSRLQSPKRAVLLMLIPVYPYLRN